MPEAALQAVAARLREHDVPFLLGGSALLRALGVDVEVRDVDLMLRAGDRERFEVATAKWWVATTTEPGPTLTSAWKATLDVGGVEVEGLGGLGFTGGPELPFRAGGEWHGIPLAAPELWWAVYRRYKPEKAALLEAVVAPGARARALAELGYDAVAERYLESIARTEGDPRLRFLDDFAARLEPGAEVLDLGCGAGRPNAERLAARFAVTGVDVSARQLALARERLPAARFLHADMTELELPAGGFAGAVALYSLVHVPRERHGELLARIAGWLRPGGLLLAALGTADEPGSIAEDWLGAPMYFSSHCAAENRRLLAAAGFEPLRDEVVTIREPAGEAAFQWLLGRRQVRGVVEAAQ